MNKSYLHVSTQVENYKYLAPWQLKQLLSLMEHVLQFDEHDPQRVSLKLVKIP